jgi:hypothetical protein
MSSAIGRPIECVRAAAELVEQDITAGEIILGFGVVQRVEQAGGQPVAHRGILRKGAAEGAQLVEQGVASRELVLGLGVVQRVE